MFTPRDYQTEALADIAKYHKEGIQCQLGVMATGLGKTVVFSHVPLLNPGVTMVLAHRSELLKQAGEKMQAINPNAYIDIEMAEKRAHYDSDIILSSVATVGRGDLRRLKKFAGRIKNLIIDEGHHAVAPGYQNVIEALGFTKEEIKYDPEKLLFLVTATPNRADNKGLEKICDKIVFNKDLRYGVEEGWLVDINAFKVLTGASLDGVGLKGGDYKDTDLGKAVDTDDRNIKIVRGYIDHALGKKAICFCANVEHAIHIAELFNSEGVKAEVILGTTDKCVREAISKRYNYEDTMVLVNVGVATEGYDSPVTQCVIHGRPTKSQPLYIQMTGRGTRVTAAVDQCATKEDRLLAIASSSKRSLIVLDVVDNCSKHLPIQVATLFGLNPNIDLRETPVVKAVREIEEVLREAPNIDVSKITDLKKLQQLKTQALKVNIWESVALAKEVKENSRFTWQKWNDGSFHITLDKHETMILKENTLGQWDAMVETTATWNGSEYERCEPKVEQLGQEQSAHDIFTRSDRFIEANYPELTKIIVQNAKWHSDDATPKQYELLRKYKYPVFNQDGRVFINDGGNKIPLTKGLAGGLITRKLTEFRQNASNRKRAANS